MKGIKAKVVFFTIIAFLALTVVIYFGAKYITDEHLFDKPKETENKVDNSIIVGTYIDTMEITDTNKNVTKSTITFDDKKKFVLNIDDCSKSIQLDGTYEIKNSIDINLTFNTNNENYSQYIGESNHKNDKITMDASGMLTYVGDSFGCSPAKSAIYTLKIDPVE